MFCIRCGTKLEGQPKFCHRCGQPLPPAGKPMDRASPQPSLPGLPPATARTQLSARPHPWLRRLVTCGLLVFVLVFLCGAGTAVLYFGLGLQRTEQLARIVPADAVAYATFSPSLQQLPQVSNRERLTSVPVALTPLLLLPGVADVAIRLEQELPLAQLDIDPRYDLFPWLGREISLVVLSPDSSARQMGQLQPVRYSLHSATTYSGPSLVVAVPTRSRLASHAFLDKLRGQLEAEGVRFAATTYQDIVVTAVISPTNVPLLYATVNDLVILATDRPAMETVIDQALGENSTPSLYDNAPYRQSLARLPRNRLGYLYLDAASMGAEFAKVSEVFPFWSLHAVEQIGLAFALSGDGMRLDYHAQYNNAALTVAEQAWLQQLGNPHQLARHIPASALAYWSSQDLPLAFEAYNHYLFNEGGVRELEDKMGVRLSRLLADIGASEAAWVLLDEPDGTHFATGQLPLGILLLIQAEEDRRIQDDLEQAVALLAAAEGWLFYEELLQESSVWLVENRQSDVFVAGYGFTTDNILFLGTSAEALREIAEGRRRALRDVFLYQAVMAALPDGGHTYFYLDMSRSDRVLERTLDARALAHYEENVRPHLRRFRAVGAAMLPMDDDGVVRGDVFLLTD